MTEVLKVIAWPLALVILSFGALFIFRAELRKLIPRVKKLWGVDLETPPAQQLATDSTPGQSQRLSHPFDSIVLKEWEEAIRRDSRLPADLNRRVEALVTHLAAANLLLAYEMISRTIWGTQIDLLLDINTKATGEEIERLRRYYEAAAAQANDDLAGYPYEKYLEYLRNQGLVIESEGRLHITNFAKEFLAHLARTGATYRRQF